MITLVKTLKYAVCFGPKFAHGNETKFLMFITIAIL